MNDVLNCNLRNCVNSYYFVLDKLNKRIYTVGGTNKADDSLLGVLPFSVNILPEEINTKTGQALPTLREQIYGLTPLSFSYNTSLVSNGEDHSGTFQVYTYDDTIILCSLSMIYVIKKISVTGSFPFEKWLTIGECHFSVVKSILS